MSNYITTFSKLHINPLNPEPDKINILDIAHALSLICRANGHFMQFYSVAQHSINCANEAKARGFSEKIQLACLLHDASEAYLSDITRPVKKHLPHYLSYEKIMQDAIWNVFGLNDLAKDELIIVEEIDDTILFHEFKHFMDEMINDNNPKLLSEPNFEFRDFSSVEQELIRLSHLKPKKKLNHFCIGVDGCKGGWICAILDNDELEVKKFASISSLTEHYPGSNQIIVDIPIGLQSHKNHIRPDSEARHIIRERSSTIFPAPCRQAVYANTVAEAYIENERNLGKKFTPLTVGIIPKIKEVDAFLQKNPKYKNRLLESHPEVCFAMLNKQTLLSKKNEIDGINERIHILEHYIPSLKLTDVLLLAKQYKCNIDDILDAICLAVTAMFVSNNEYKTIPEHPMTDETGIVMQMVVPKFSS